MFNLFTDGSYNRTTGKASYAFVIVDDLNQVLAQGNGFTQSNNLWNVSGEIEAVLQGIEKAKELEIKVLTIYTDYQGIISWVNGEWETKNNETQEYVEKMKENQKIINIKYNKVKAHSGIYYNEFVDNLAKEVLK